MTATQIAVNESLNTPQETKAVTFDTTVNLKGKMKKSLLW